MQIHKNKSFLLDCVQEMFQEHHYSGKNECNSALLQLSVFSSKTREKMETSNRFECIKHASIGPNIQDGDCRGHQELHLQSGMGSICRPHRRILPHSHSSKVAKPSALSCRKMFFPMQSPIFRYSDGSTRIYPHCQRGKANAARQRYMHSPVLGQLATASFNTADLLGAIKTTGRVCPGTRLGNKLQKFDFLVYRFDLSKGEVLPTEKKWLILTTAIEDLNNSLTTPRILMSFIGILVSLEKTVPMGRLHMRPFQWYLKTHWKYPQLLDKKIPCSVILRKNI